MVYPFFLEKDFAIARCSIVAAIKGAIDLVNTFPMSALSGMTGALMPLDLTLLNSHTGSSVLRLISLFTPYEMPVKSTRTIKLRARARPQIALCFLPHMAPTFSRTTSKNRLPKPIPIVAGLKSGI